MTYAPPVAAVKAAERALRQTRTGNPAYAVDVVQAVTPIIAADVVAMTEAGLSAVVAHDPTCTNLFDDSEPCDCTWAAVVNVIAQVKAKVAPVP